MPYTIRKVRGRNCYRVKNQKSKRIMAKCTTLNRAKRQVRLLYGLENGLKPNLPNRSTRRRREPPPPR